MQETNTGSVPLEETSIGMSQNEYKAYLERQKRKSYKNHAVEGKDGKVVDAYDQIFTGLVILGESKVQLK